MGRTGRTRSGRVGGAGGAGVRRGALAAVAVLVLTAATGCTASSEDDKDGDGRDYRRITLAVPPWAGARANVAVAQRLLERELDIGVTVEIMAGADSWDALNDGSVQAILEDWRVYTDREEKYLEKRRTVIEAGDLGVTGHIGWFVPKYYADENPGITDWENLNDHVEDFQPSGGKGRFIGADAQFTNYDAHLVENLELDYRIDETEGEDGLLAAIDEAYEAREPFLTYWYEPHWKNLEIDLVEVKLPTFVEGCNDPVERADCAYPIMPLQKYFHADFEEHGGTAAEFLRNFRWSNEHQNEVAAMIGDEGAPAEEAADRWIEENETVWSSWIPERPAGGSG